MVSVMFMTYKSRKQRREVKQSDSNKRWAEKETQVPNAVYGVIQIHLLAEKEAMRGKQPMK